MKKLLLILSLLTTYTYADSHCPTFYIDKTPPISTKSYEEMCFSEYVVGYDQTKLLSGYSVEVITAASVKQSNGTIRINSFHANKVLSKDKRVKLKDYLNSGYDKGHLTPFGDMVSKQAQYESFDLVNMVPQNKVNNEQLWKRLEINVRQLATDKGTVYIVTGPVIDGSSKMLNGRIPIPKYMYKAIYIPSTKVATVFLADNDDSWNYKYISVNQLKTLTGIDVFPTLTAIQKNSAIALFTIKR